MQHHAKRFAAIAPLTAAGVNICGILGEVRGSPSHMSRRRLLRLSLSPHGALSTTLRPLRRIVNVPLAE